MKANKDEKRVLKGYKIKDSVYQKAMKRASKAKPVIPLANIVEDVVTAYSEGKQIHIITVGVSESGIPQALSSPIDAFSTLKK